MAGRRPVEEVFIAGREALRLLVVPARRAALERIVLHATSLRIPIVEVEGGTLTSLAGFDGHQGVAVVVPPRRYGTIDEILARAIERREPPFVLALDSLEDPQNVGTLLRSAEAAGVHGVIFPIHRQAPLTAAAVKASAGAVEHLLLCPVDDLAGALTDLHVRGLRVAGSEAEAPLTARQADLRGPLAIVVGSEGQGLGPAVRRRCDLLMRIPMRGAIDSLNASVAGSILLFEALGQRDPEGRSRRPEAALRLGPAIRSAPDDEADDRAGTETTGTAAPTTDAAPPETAEPAPAAVDGAPTTMAADESRDAPEPASAEAGAGTTAIADRAAADQAAAVAESDAPDSVAEALDGPPPGAVAPARAPRRRSARAVSAEGQGAIDVEGATDAALPPPSPLEVSAPPAASPAMAPDETPASPASRRGRRRTGEPAVDEPVLDVTRPDDQPAPADTSVPDDSPPPAVQAAPARPKRRTRNAATRSSAPPASSGTEEPAADATATPRDLDDDLLPGGPRPDTDR